MRTLKESDSDVELEGFIMNVEGEGTVDGDDGDDETVASVISAVSAISASSARTSSSRRSRGSRSSSNQGLHLHFAKQDALRNGAGQGKRENAEPEPNIVSGRERPVRHRYHDNTNHIAPAVKIQQLRLDCLE